MASKQHSAPDSVYGDRRQLMARVHLTSGIALSVFIAVHYFEDCCFKLSIAEGLLALVMMVTYWRIRTGAPLPLVENALMASAVALYTALILFESIEATGIYWVAGMPFVTYFVLPARTARYWVAFFAVEMTLIATLKLVGFIDVFYSAGQIYCMAAVILFYWVLAHIYKSQLELRQAQLDDSYRSLEEQQHRMQVILDHSPVGIWMVDTHRHIQFLNKAWVNWSGISEVQARQAADYSSLLSKELAAKSLLSDQICLEGDGAYYFREVFPAASGKLHTFDMVKVKLSGSAGQPLGLVGFAIDITEKLQAEAEQQSLERQVQHSQRLESLGIMAGGIAHDFNNLLTAIQGSTELARLEGHIAEPVRQSLDCIDAAAQAAIGLCRQMLAYSGKGLLKTEVFYIRELIDETRSLLDISIGKHIALAFHFDQERSPIEADRSQISQVLMNLVINASEAIGLDQQGEITISIWRRHLDAAEPERFFGTDLQAGCYTVLSVEDNGMGMDAATLEHMFDPFFTTKFTGRGLGLSAILGILRAHHAGMEVDSCPGSGSCISVWIPCFEGKLEQNRDMTDSVSTGVFAGRVLLVDDEPGVMYVAKRMLEKLGFAVITAANGRQAVELFADDQNFDWVLLDVTMPEMDGMACLAKLRAIKADLYVVLTSGYNADSAQVSSSQTQANDFLTKPFRFGALRGIAEKAMCNCAE